MTPNARVIFTALICLVAAGCQSASLEDAAPKAVPVARPDLAAERKDAPQQALALSASDAPAKPEAASQVVRRNPGVASIVPLEETKPVENKEFVASGASRSGEFPTFSKQPKASNEQFSDAEKRAAEAEMAELLRNRASTPDARARYEARLKRLRAVAASHGSDMQQKIEN